MSVEFGKQSIDELELVRGECLKLIGDVRNFCPLAEGQQYPEVFRLMATPILYSAWERCFTLCHAIALRVLQHIAQTPNSLTSVQRAIWLMRTPFFNSLHASLAESTDKTPRRGHFAALCKFLAAFDEWSNCSFDHAADTGELVMRFSNVNPEVVELNAEAIGFSKVQMFPSFKYGRLHDLVGQRNGIGHGSTIEAPKHEAFIDLFEFTESLINHYCDCAVEWVKQQTGQPATQVEAATTPTP